MSVRFYRLNGFNDTVTAKNMAFKLCKSVFSKFSTNSGTLPQGRDTGFFSASRQIRHEGMLGSKSRNFRETADAVCKLVKVSFAEQVCRESCEDRENREGLCERALYDLEGMRNVKTV